MIHRFLFLAILTIAALKANGQIYIGVGTGLYLNQAYQNTRQTSNHRYVFSEGLNFSTQLGWRKEKSNYFIISNYTTINQSLVFPNPSFTTPRLKMPRRTLSISGNYGYRIQNIIELQFGIGTLLSQEWNLQKELEEVNQISSDISLFSERRISPFLSLGLDKQIPVNKKIYITTSLSYRIGILSLNSSFQQISFQTDERPIPFIFSDFLYINKGNAFVMNINLIFLIK